MGVMGPEWPGAPGDTAELVHQTFGLGPPV